MSLSRRHFLLQGDNDGIGRLRTDELLVRHPVQLFRREMHVLMQVLVLLGSRQAPTKHFASRMPALRVAFKGVIGVWRRTSGVLTAQRAESGGVPALHPQCPLRTDTLTHTGHPTHITVGREENRSATPGRGREIEGNLSVGHPSQETAADKPNLVI